MKVYLLLLVFALTACGGDESDNNNVNTDNHSDKASLSDLVGVWDSTIKVKEGDVVSYFVIKENGDLDTYYISSSSDDEGSCYAVIKDTIVGQGDGRFSFLDSEFIISSADDKLTFINVDKDGEKLGPFSRATLLENDLQLLCDETDETSLSDLVGVWDSTIKVKEGDIVSYFVIKENGDLNTYYISNSSDDERSCYAVIKDTIVDQEDGSFSFLDSEFIISSADDELTFISMSKDLEKTGPFSRATLLESDLQSLCGEPAETSLSDLVGVWDVTIFDSRGYNYIQYSVIKESGDLLSYKYDGDSFGQGENCYSVSNSKIVDIGGSNFLFISSDGEETQCGVKVTNNEMALARGNTYSVYGSRSHLLESDFQSIMCDE